MAKTKSNDEVVQPFQTEYELLNEHLAETIMLLESRIDDKNKIIRLLEQSQRKANNWPIQIKRQAAIWRWRLVVLIYRVFIL